MGTDGDRGSVARKALGQLLAFSHSACLIRRTTSIQCLPRPGMSKRILTPNTGQ